MAMNEPAKHFQFAGVVDLLKFFFFHDCSNLVKKYQRFIGIFLQLTSQSSNDSEVGIGL
jgi:hypothetical protein